LFNDTITLQYRKKGNHRLFYRKSLGPQKYRHVALIPNLIKVMGQLDPRLREKGDEFGLEKPSFISSKGVKKD
jgi:hypothetical protein